MLIGFVINPFAGIGGAVGLKGSDGEARERALRSGARAIAAIRAAEALRSAGDLSQHSFLTASGDMGESVLRSLGLRYQVIHMTDSMTTADDTVACCRTFCARSVALVIFCGGDGTAADVMRGMTGGIPVLGIPSGVKMHSGVFANTPLSAGLLLKGFGEGSMATKQGEVMDIDEELFRTGILKARLIGTIRVLDDTALVQPPKGTISVSDDEEDKESIAEWLACRMEPGILYIIGPGTTCEVLVKMLGFEKTLLGVDLWMDGGVLKYDVPEADIMAWLSKVQKARIVVTPIGAQGLIFGRGNQQISASVLRKVGQANIIVIATPGKLRGIRSLKVDTGDPELDRELHGYQRVVVGFNQERLVRLE